VDGVLGVADAAESRSEPLSRDGVCHEISVHHQCEFIMPERTDCTGAFEVD
jgi:hypothetical protein